MRPLDELAGEVANLQDACNLSAVLAAFQTAVADLWEHAMDLRKGTDWVNKHPITRAYVSKLVALSGYQAGDGTFTQIIDLIWQRPPGA